MKPILPFILAILFSSSLSADICDFVFTARNTLERGVDLKNIDRINRLEGWSKSLRLLAYKESPYAPTAFRKSAQKFNDVEKGLLSGNSDDAIHAYRLLFRKVEGSSLIIERYEELASALKKAQGAPNIESFLIKKGVVESLASEYGALAKGGGVVKARKKVQKILRKRYRKLGRDFASYNHAQQSLKKLKGAEYCGPQCREAIEDLYAKIGLKGEGVMFGPLLGSKRVYSIEEVRKLFNSRPSSILAARKKEFLQEGFAVLSKYVKKFRVLKRAINGIADSRWGKHKYVIRIFKGVFDARYFKIDEVAIKRVSKSNFSTSKKLTLAQEQSADIDQGLFFMNFSRSTDGEVQKTWRELKDAAEMSDKELHKTMLEAEELGRRLGPPSERKLTKAFQILAGVGIAGTGWAYFNFDMESDEVDATNSEADDLVRQLDQIDADELESESGEGPEILIEYLKKEDAQVTEFLGTLIEMERELGKDSAPVSKD